VIENLDDFRALDPFFRTIEEGLAGYVDGEHFFDMLAQDVGFDFIITVPNYPRHIVAARTSLNSTEAMGPRCSSTGATTCVSITHRQRRRWCSNTPPREGVVATGDPYGNRYISVVVIKDRKVAEWRHYLDPLRVFAALEGRPFEPDGSAATDPRDN
jgi:ketosteroid isomerase-like protein